MMTVCYFGIYKPTYARNSALIRGLKENGVEVIECNTREEKNVKYWRLIKRYWQIKNQFQVMIVGFPGHTIMPWAWLLAKIHRKKIIFDAFVSLYDSIIKDRQKYSPFGLKALKYWLIDWLACRLADKILLDAEAHIDYFVRTFKINRKKFKSILVSCDDQIMKPRAKKTDHDYFLVHFHGTYLPIQGINYILEAAEILKGENIKFNLIGRLKDYRPEIEKAQARGLTNVNFIDFLPYQELADYMAQADICLGMFGRPAKAFRCGAFKITEALALGKPLLTGETPALKEFLKDRESCLFCRMGDGADLAEKILMLKNNPALREKIASGGREVYLKYLTPKATAGELKILLEALINK